MGGVVSVVASDIKIHFTVVSKDITQGITISKTYGKIIGVNNKMGEYFIKLASISS